MRISEDVRKYAAEQGASEEEALKKGMEAKSKKFVEKAAATGLQPSRAPKETIALHNRNKRAA